MGSLNFRNCPDNEYCCFEKSQEDRKNGILRTQQEVDEVVSEQRRRHAELNGKIIVPALPASTKKVEEALVDNLLYTD